MGVERLAASLTRLQDALGEVRLPLDVPGAAEHRELIRTQIDQIEDYVLPRLRRLDAPLLTVVGGSTGAGKSTLVNSLIGRTVSQSGVIRPTTRSSVLVHHPEDARWFESGLILPGLARSETAVTDPRVLQLVPEETMPRGLAILDAPDVDSIVAENRVLAAQLLAAADLWLFVTSAARYADAVPWQYLRAAARRRAVVAVVLDRVPPAAMSDVPPHLGQMMSQRGLGASPLFAIPETVVDEAGLLPDSSVSAIRGWLADLAEDTVRRNQVVLQTLDGAIQLLATQGPEIIAAVADQNEAVDTLRSDAEKSFAEAVRSVAAQTADGTLLRGEVLARWQDFVGTGEFFRAVEKRIGLFRDRVVQVAKGEPKQAQDLQLAVESGLEVLIREEGEFAARRVVSAWEAHPAGRQLLARDGALGKVSLDFAESAARVIRQWQGDVLELVGSEGKSKKAMARYLALGVNGAGVALMIFVFSQTGGLVGAEVGVAGGTALLAQRVLEAVFGEDAVRRLAKEAKLQLDSRVEGLMASELARFEKLLDEIEARPEQGEQLTAALNGLQMERTDEDRYEREVVGAPALPVPETDESSAEELLQAEAVVDAPEVATVEEAADPADDQADEAGVEDAGAEDAGAEDAGVEDAGAEDAEVADGQADEAGAEGAEAEDAAAEDAAAEDAETEDSGAEAGADAVAVSEPESAAVGGAGTDAPQRFVDGDTGLLPSLVAAQLSALAQDARRGDGDADDAVSDEVVSDEAVSDAAVSDAVVSDEVVSDEAVDPDREVEEPIADEPAGPLEEPEPPVARQESIPVPAGFAALVAEAVRRPDDLDESDAEDALAGGDTSQGKSTEDESAEDLAEEQVDEEQVDVDRGEDAPDEPVVAAFVLPTPPPVMTPPPMTMPETVASAESPAPAEAPAPQLSVALPPPPGLPMPAVAPPVALPPVALPTAPLPVAPPVASVSPSPEAETADNAETADDAALVDDVEPAAAVLLAPLTPPESVPPAPPVPAWPLPEPPVIDSEGE